MKKVVVIGGGFAGSLIAQKLERDFAITLIDSKNYFEFTPGILRTIVEPDHWKKIRVLHRAYLKRADIAVGIVTDVTPQYVLVGKQTIPFDYLVICSGSSYNAPIKEQHVILPVRAKHLVTSHRKLEDAKKVLIIGGGLVGVQLAAEIATHYNDKHIKLIHAHKVLMERNAARSQAYAARFLQERGVEIIYNERVAQSDNGVYRTDKGRDLRADIIFLCTGIIPNFSFLLNYFSSALTKEHQVQVNERLQVKGFKHIFAAGDITDTRVEKTAQNAEKQGAVVIANIHALERGEPLQEYVPRKTPQVIDLGRWDGIFEVGENVITGLIPALLKQAIEKREMWRRGVWRS